jgi:hypothetical protein
MRLHLMWRVPASDFGGPRASRGLSAVSTLLARELRPSS